MNHFTNKVWSSRRDFLRSTTQGGVLVALTGLVALAVRGRGVLLPGDCRGAGHCGGCAMLATCGLPPAATARKSTSKG
jgi:ferredoxin